MTGKIQATMDRILAQAKEVKRMGDGWRMCCPAHDDVTDHFKTSHG